MDNNVGFSELEILLQNIGFIIKKDYFEIPKIPKTYGEHLRWGLSMELVPFLDYALPSSGEILKTSIGQLSPGNLIEKFLPRIIKGEIFECFYREVKVECKFKYKDGVLTIERI